jgi:hypothetical protein
MPFEQIGPFFSFDPYVTFSSDPYREFLEFSRGVAQAKFVQYPSGMSKTLSNQPLKDLVMEH